MFNISELRNIREAVIEKEEFWHERVSLNPTPYGKEMLREYEELHKKITNLICEYLLDDIRHERSI